LPLPDWIASESGADGQIRYRLGQASAVSGSGGIARGPAGARPALPAAYDIAHSQRRTTDVLSGRINGEQALFGEAGIIPWVKYFSNDNPMYAISTGSAIAGARRQRTPKRSWKSRRLAAVQLRCSTISRT